jgi:copper homeostasis protein
MQNQHYLEVVAANIESCLAAEEGGASRIELCSALSADGVTPNAGLIRKCLELVKIPVYVMIRPREGHFHYHKHDADVMRADIETALGLGAHGIVIGALTAAGEVDTLLTSELVKLTNGAPVTFHRAFDVVNDKSTAWKQIADCGCSTILTSGGAKTALEGIATIHALAEESAGQIQIMPGSGISASNLPQLFHPKIKFYHMSGKVNAAAPYVDTIFTGEFGHTHAQKIADAKKVLEHYNA